MNEDAELLRRYLGGSEAAFGELVRKYVDLVYGAAYRRTGTAHLAGDVAQEVFTSLALGAQKLSRHAVLAAWLHTATRNAALNLMISENRRRVRETAASAQIAAAGAPDPAWNELRPVLDAAIDELPDADRAAVVLRFLRRHSYAEIGTELAVSADAARMRTERALERLRTGLARKGISSTAAALAGTVAGHAGIAAPAGLAAALASGALVGASTGAGATAGVAWAALFLMKTKVIAVAALIALLVFWGGYRAGQRRGEAPTRTTAAKSDTQKADNPAARPKRAVASAPATPATPTSESAAASTVRAAVEGNLRQLSAAIRQFTLENQRPPNSLLELVGPGKIIRSLNSVDGEDYSGVSLTGERPLAVTTGGGVTATFDPNAPKATLSAESRQQALQRQFPFLTPEKVAQIDPVLAEYDRLAAELGQIGLGGIRGLGPAELEKRNMLKEAARGQIAAILSPDELFEYDLRTDEMAVALRGEATLFAPTESELRTLYRLRKEFDAQYGPGPDVTIGPLRGLRPSQNPERDSHLPELDAQIISALGPNRASEYKLMARPGAAAFAAMVKRQQIPPDAVREVLTIQQDFEQRVAANIHAFEQQVAANRQDTSLSAEAKLVSQRNAAFRDEAVQRVASILGPENAEAYKRNGGNWMTTRFNGM